MAISVLFKKKKERGKTVCLCMYKKTFMVVTANDRITIDFNGSFAFSSFSSLLQK